LNFDISNKIIKQASPAFSFPPTQNRLQAVVEGTNTKNYKVHAVLHNIGGLEVYNIEFRFEYILNIWIFIETGRAVCPDLHAVHPQEEPIF
jgi:hypothetical protein